MVEDLIDSKVGVWKKCVISHLFNQMDAEFILNIPFVPSLPEDKLVWHYTKSGYVCIWAWNV